MVKGIQVGIITDGRSEEHKNKLNALELDVDDVIITDELGGVQFREPCDIAFRIMKTHWRLNPADMVNIGDNPNIDFQILQHLGINTAYFSNPDGLYKGIYEYQGVTISTITDFVEII